MRVFLAGATGVIGRLLLPLLIRSGYQVTAMTRSHSHAEQIRTHGGKLVVCDAFDADRLHDAVGAARPDVVINQLTNIPRRLHPRRVKKEMATTNRLRTEATRVLVEAAKSAGASRFVTQSLAFVYGPVGAQLATEEQPLYPDPPVAFADMIRAAEISEHIVLNSPGRIDGIVMRYGYFYGPGTIYARDGSFGKDVQRRRIPVVGDGGGIFSFIHVEDAAAATVVALERGHPGVYNIVDDEPAAVREWLPFYAELLGAPRPFKVPDFLGRLAGGPYGMYLLTRQRGASNRKARERLGWQPNFSTWRDGFRLDLVA